MEAKMDVHQEGMEAKMDGWLGEMKVWWNEMVAYQEAMKACLERKEPNHSGDGKHSGTPWGL
jgi:hypothetical protein